MSLIIKPLLTEKYTELNKSGKYGFKVALKANKIEIKKAIEKMYGVKVEAVQTQEAQAEQQKAEEKATRQTSSSRPQPSLGGDIAKSVIKVATSATFIRGVFGVLNKMFRK